MEKDPIKESIIDSNNNKTEKFLLKRNIINYGDLIVIYEKGDSIKYLTLEKGKTFQNKFGIFSHDDIYQKEYGSKIYSKKGGSGYIVILSFVPNIWERCINKMTQIIFNPDISLIMTLLNIRTNSIIYESGTGSGCLSTNMASVLSSNNGHLYTFEFNKERAEKLKDLFKLLKLDNIITITYRDVIENGFELKEEELSNKQHSKCDGIFIDLPSPWEVIEKANKVLKTNGKIVTFSPCIEQIQKTAKCLKDNGFIDIRMFECIYRAYSYTKTITVNIPTLKNRKFGEDIETKETEINLTKNKVDMRGHTGFILYGLKICE